MSLARIQMKILSSRLQPMDWRDIGSALPLAKAVTFKGICDDVVAGTKAQDIEAVSKAVHLARVEGLDPIKLIEIVGLFSRLFSITDDIVLESRIVDLEGNPIEIPGA